MRNIVGVVNIVDKVLRKYLRFLGNGGSLPFEEGTYCRSEDKLEGLDVFFGGTEEVLNSTVKVLEFVV